MQEIHNSNYDLPPELCTKPLALIGVSGLETASNAVHHAIWEIFNNRRSERAPVLFKIIANDHEFPVSKPKRNSYDWYIPKGILKRNWMAKHLYALPAVMVIFYELDWNDSMWNEKMVDCASRVQSMRTALDGRNTRISVVLIQNSAPLPPREDILASERAVALCASCELHSTSLFVLPHGDHLLGYALRLENAFFDFAQNYYNNEAKIVRSHKEHLNKNTHQYLYVRHQFKMGFLYELKQDFITAHKHYTHAYNNLLEIRIVDTNALEIRTIAGFISYKLSKLMFSLNLPKDAITHFKSHMERFKHRMGFQDLSFEHYAWLSKQYAVFGDIFDDAVKLGLPAVQVQHPGIYYQQAAQNALIRKKISQELCSKVVNYPQPDPLRVTQMDFYGQRPWRPGKLTAEPPDPQLESSGIQALQFLEKQVNHSNIIISLYGLAVSQFKTYRCPRTRKHLVIQMADEYYNSQDYGKALTLLTHMLWDFRTEKWWYLMTNILEKAINCAFLTASVQDYVLLSLEILSKNTQFGDDYKKVVYENLCRVLQKQIPFGDSKLSSEVTQNATIAWQAAISQKNNFSFDMANITTCIETKASFVQKQYEVDQKVEVEIFVRNTSAFQLSLSRVAVLINSPEFTSEYAVLSSSEQSQLLFQSGEVKRFIVEFYPDLSDIHKDIQIGSINIIIGNINDFNFEFKYATQNIETAIVFPELLHFKLSKSKLDFDNLKILNSTTIIPRHSNLNISYAHKNPALTGEWYEICATIVNEEQYNIKELEILVCLGEEEVLNTPEVTTNPFAGSEPLPLKLKIQDALQKDASFSTKFYLRLYKACDLSIQLKTKYILDKEKPVISTKTDIIAIPVIKPFEVFTKYVSTLMCEIDKIHVGEEFGVMPAVRSLSPWPIVIDKTTLKYNEQNEVRQSKSSIPSPLRGKILNNNEVGTEFFLSVCDKVHDQNFPLAQYVVEWKRVGSQMLNTTSLMILGNHSEKVSLKLRLKAPAHGYVRTPLMVEYILENTSSQLIQLDVSMEASEGYMFSGYKQYSINILPNSPYFLKYNLYPLIAGSVALPKLNLTIPEGVTDGPSLRPEQIKALIKRSLPTHLYVIPQIKGSPKIPDFINPKNIVVK